jgi:hypothetical protein
MRLAALAPLALLAACGPSDSDPGPGGVTVGEAKALDEAAEMLEQRRLPPDALPSGDASASATASAAAEGEKQ